MANAHQQKKILVIGLGPVGSIFSAHLAASGFPVWGVDIWKEHCLKINEEGVRIEGVSPRHAFLRQACVSVDSLDNDRFDFVVIAVKTPFLPDVVEKMKTLPGPFVTVSLQNGIGIEEFLAKQIGEERVLRVVVNYAGNVKGPGTILMTFFNKPNQVGCICSHEICEHARELADCMNKAGLETEAVKEIAYYTWKKTILNAAVSPISAVLEMTVKEVMYNENTLRQVKELLKESIAVADKMGYHYGEGFFQDCLDYLVKAGNHTPSMLTDLESGNPTEMDYVNGKIVEAGRLVQVPVPVNTVFTNLVKAKETLRKK
jgi:2-dehydropantoate 2-reductase